MKLRIGDNVLVTAGKDKTRQGKVEKVFPKKNTVLVQGLNVYKKHQKGFGGLSAQAGQKGGIIEFSRPLPLASVSLICPNCGNPTRVGVMIDKTGEHSRVCRKCKRIIGVGQEKKG